MGGTSIFSGWYCYRYSTCTVLCLVLGDYWALCRPLDREPKPSSMVRPSPNDNFVFPLDREPIQALLHGAPIAQ